MSVRANFVSASVLMIGLLLLNAPAPALAVISLRIEPSIGWRNLAGDAGEFYEDSRTVGLAVSAGLPTFPLRVRGGVDRSSHDSRLDPDGELAGTVLSLDVLYQMGVGLAGIYAFGGVARSNLEDDSAPFQDAITGDYVAVYEKGNTMVRAGGGIRASFVPKLGVFGEGSYSFGEKGRNDPGFEAGRLSFLDLKVGAAVTF